MLSGSIEYTLRLNLWYSFDGRPLHSVEVQDRSLVKKLQLKAFRHIDVRRPN